MRWFEIDPLDTLFFRGAEPMEPGETHVQSSEFPPLPITLIGAVRTAALVRAGVTFMPGWNDMVDAGVRTSIGVDIQPPATFRVMGPLFAYHGEPLYPTPADWRQGEDGRMTRLNPTNAGIAGRWGIRHSSGTVSLPWFLGEPSKEAAFTRWVTAQSLAAGDRGDRVSLVEQEKVFATESRVGLALEGRRAKDGHLYSTSHIRLRSGVTMLFGLDGVPSSVFPDTGLLQWGGEQRLVQYRGCSGVTLPWSDGGSRWLALIPVQANRLDPAVPALHFEGQSVPLSTWVSGKFRKIGGWNLATRSHKPLISWFPAGSVFYPAQAPDRECHERAGHLGLVWI